ncbi:MAG: epoxyqueuosine reductase, partial [Candidatus Acidiferrales bacterium]
MNATERTQWVTERAREVGFDLCGVAPAADFDELARLPGWLDRGYAGEMRYLHDSRRQSPAAAMPGARSIIVCALNYNTPHPYSSEAHVAATLSRAHSRPEQTSPSSPAPSAVRSPGPRGWISRYAWGDDYHHVLGEKLEVLVAAMRAEFREPFEARAYVDTGPVVERVAAKYAGLGWLGKNTCLINEHLGSWLFIGVILTTLELQPSLYDEMGKSAAPRSVGTGSPKSEVSGQMSDAGLPTSDLRLQVASHSPLATNHLLPPPDLCGNCTQCIDACPTGAIVEPYVLDARRCISYLTIELRGPIPEDLREAMGWHVFGCDICQDVCPFNRRA